MVVVQGLTMRDAGCRREIRGRALAGPTADQIIFPFPFSVNCERDSSSWQNGPRMIMKAFKEFGEAAEES